MRRVIKSRNLLHTKTTENKLDTWDGLIFAAESELKRIKERSDVLAESIQVLRKKKQDGEPVALATL
jgi:hypothetical protein